MDAQAFAGLLSDEKELAEHRMLVDLARNDLARFCEPGSVRLSPDRLLERLDAGPVLHLASEVRGRIGQHSPLRVLLGIHPMGTVSGAPKVRAMQMIHELEGGKRRGMYGGVVGFADVSGNLEAVIGLRTVTRNGTNLNVQAGAGIVADSIPASEFAETEAKMSLARRVIEPFLIRSPELHDS